MAQNDMQALMNNYPTNTAQPHRVNKVLIIAILAVIVIAVVVICIIALFSFSKTSYKLSSTEGDPFTSSSKLMQDIAVAYGNESITVNFVLNGDNSCMFEQTSDSISIKSYCQLDGDLISVDYKGDMETLSYKKSGNDFTLVSDQGNIIFSR